MLCAFWGERAPGLWTEYFVTTVHVMPFHKCLCFKLVVYSGRLFKVNTFMGTHGLLFQVCDLPKYFEPGVVIPWETKPQTMMEIT